jgi:hypothetical protein
MIPVPKRMQTGCAQAIRYFEMKGVEELLFTTMKFFQRVAFFSNYCQYWGLNSGPWAY